MLTLNQFKGLEVGDVIEATPFLPGLCEEPTVLKVTAISPEHKVKFEVSYCTVIIGNWKCREENNKLVWAF